MLWGLIFSWISIIFAVLSTKFTLERATGEPTSQERIAALLAALFALASIAAVIPK